MRLKYFLTSICLLFLNILYIAAQTTNTLSIPDVSVAPGKTISLPVQMDNTADIAAVQFTLTVPEGVILDAKSVKLSERSNGHSVILKQLDTHKYMAMIFSPNNNALKGRSGELLTVPLTASASMTEGSTHTFVLTDVVIADNKGNNLTTGYSSGQLTIAKRPDLEISQITTPDKSITPGGKITVNWQVRNIGGMPTGAGWSEQIFLDGANNNSKLIATTYYQETLAVGGTIARSADIEIPQILGIDTEATLRVKIIPNNETGEPTGLDENNTASTTETIAVGKVLALSPDKISTEEAEGNTIRLYLTRSGSTENSEVFSLEATSDSRITFPTDITIDKDQSGAYFYAQITANQVIDNDSIIDFMISGNGYPTIKNQITIKDDTYPMLSITSEAQDVTEGGNIKLVINTERISSVNIPIHLTCDEINRFIIPSDIVIPAGEKSVTVSIEAKEDDIPNVEQVITFTASAENYNPGSLNTVLLDNDIPNLQMELTPTAISEGAGPIGVTAVLRRTNNIDKTVTIKFSDDSNSNIYYTKPTLEMKAGVEEATVKLGPIDNTIVDGERIYNISASVYIASCSCSASQENSGGVVTKQLTVYDNDGPALSMRSPSSILKEGGEMTITIERNTETAQELTVHLSSEHNESLEFPASIIIPKGEKSGSFIVKSKSNSATGDDLTVNITAEAEGFAKGNIWFSISDQTLPDAQITEASLSENEVEVNSKATLTFTLYNSGLSELPEQTEVGIYLVGASTQITYAYLQSPLAAGQSVVMQKDITLPENIGEYTIYATANPNNKVKELLYNNNASGMISITTIAPYTTMVQVDKTTYNKGEAINITGKIQGKDISSKAVEIYIINSGYRHTIQVTSDENGAFQTIYTPYEGQIGHFTVGACYPNEKATVEQASFHIYGLKRDSNQAITHEIILGEAQQGTCTLLNPGERELTDIKARIVSQPDNCEIHVECPQSISGNGSADVKYSLTSNETSTGNDWQKIEMIIESKEGASLPITLYYYCRNNAGQLQASVTRITTTMQKNSSRDYPFTITNTGKGETGKISLALPSWITSATPKEIASLETNASATVILRFNPTENMQLNVPITGTIGINCENGNGLSIPYSVEPVSESTGTLTIDVCDEYTYYTNEAPHVSGAEVTISHPTTGKVIAQGVTGKDGTFSTVLPEGYYAVRVTASKHNTYQNNILVDPGKENILITNLSYEAITIDYNVEETEIEDEYEIKTNVKYETNVPVPVVELLVPSKIDAKSLSDGESLIFYATLTNKGLITAEDVEFLLPEGFKTLSFESLSYTEPFTLAPQQSVRIPVKVTKVVNTFKTSLARTAPIDNDPCVGQPGTLYHWDCGNDRKWHRYGVAMQLGSCNSKDPSTWDNSGNGTYGGGSGSGWGPGSGGSIGGPIGGSPIFSASTENKPISQSTDQGCEPCQNKFMLSMIKCGSHFIPIVKKVLTIIGWITDTSKKATEAGINKVNETIEKYVPVYGWVNKIIGYKEIYDDCIVPLFKECDLEGSSRIKAKDKSLGNNYPSYIIEYQNELKILVDAIDAEINRTTEFWGNDEWLKADPDELYTFLITFKKYINEEVTQEELMLVKPQALSKNWVSSFIERWENTINESSDENRIDFNQMSSYGSIVNGAIEHVVKQGYSNLSEYFTVINEKLNKKAEEASQSVCSSITLQFSQSMVMTRQAFRGTLTVFNGHESTAMEDVRLYLEVKDMNGKLATSHEFQINPESLNGFTGNLNLTDGWSLEAGQTGVATILYIPTRYAAPSEDTKYSFGGMLSYVDPYTGLEVTRILAPVTLTVKPSPVLNLTYFMQRDIMGDDPLTEAIEPCEEAEFSVLINNIGYGDANNVQMITEQPQIIENEKGLLIDFELMSSQLNGGEKTLALGGNVATDFGNIPAKSQTYAQWWIKSSLLGHFTDYDIKATHISSYDNPDLSLLNEVNIHELIRSLDIQETEKPAIGFLTNDIVDANDTPDMLYLSNGTTESVATASSIQLNRKSSTEYILNVTSPKEGWIYGNISDPTYGVSKLKSVVRQSDGKEISLRNFWQTDRTLRDGKDPLYENRIHFADNFKEVTESYLLTFEPAPQLILEVADIEGIPAEKEIATQPLETVTVVFNKYIQPETFTSEDLVLNIQGVKQDSKMISISTTDNKNFTLDLSEINKVCGNGYYTLSIQTAGIVDYEGFSGKEGKLADWILYKDGSIQINGSVYPETAGKIIYPDLKQINYGSSFKLSAVAAEGYEFVNWTLEGKNISDAAEIELVALNDMNVIANFKKKLYNVQIDSEYEGGSIQGYYTGNYEYGNTLTLNAIPNEDYIFEGWLVNSATVGKNPTLEIKVEKDLNISALFIRDLFQQRTALYKGWNWMSTYLQEAMPVEMFTENVSRIVGQFEELINDPVYGVVGKIDSLRPGVGYKIETPMTFVTTSKGHLHDIEENIISIKQGWNWISYPYFENRPREIITNAEEGDYIIAQDGFAEYSNGTWEGTFETFIPGNGYLYKSISEKDLKFDLTESTSWTKSIKRVTKQHEEEPYINIRQYPNTMNIIGRLYLDNQDVTDSHLRIYAIAGNEIRGISQYIEGKYYLTVYGDEPVDLSLIVEDKNTGETFVANEKLPFRNDVMGCRKSPYKITMGQTTNIESFDHEKRNVKIYSLSGVLLFEDATPETIKKLSRGVYIIDGQKYIVK